MSKVWLDRPQSVCLFALFSFLLAACSAGLGERPGELQLEPTATATVYTGRATAVRANVLGGVSAVLADTGSLPRGGGVREARLVQGNVPGLLTTGIIDASTLGRGNRTFSEASTAELNLTVAGIGITAQAVQSAAAARCRTGTNTSPILNGNSQIIGLVVAGNNVNVTGQPNQRVNLPGGLGQIIINEQVRNRNGNTGSIRVNALRVTVPGVANVVVSSSQAGITCTNADQPGSPGGPGNPGGGLPDGELARGSGSIICDASGRCITFAVSGGRSTDGTLFGKGLMLEDAERGLIVRSQSITDYRVVDDNTRIIRGTATANGRSGFTYQVTVSDNGRGPRDVIRIAVSNPQGRRILLSQEALECGNLRILQLDPNRTPNPNPPTGRPCNC